MKIRIAILYNIMLVTLVSCSFKNVTNVTIQNENSYPISVIVEANNISEKYIDIQPYQKIEKVFDWSNITNSDGAWHFIVQSKMGHDSFTHGYFTNGQLYSYLNLKSKGEELKVDISE
jgi:hypothetical protein